MREQQQTRGEMAQAEGLWYKTGWIKSFGLLREVRGKSNMVSNQNVWAEERVAGMGKEPEKNELHHVESSVWNFMLVANRPKS